MFLLATCVGFGGMAMIGGNQPLPAMGAAASSSHELHEILGGSRAGKLVAVADDRSELTRSEAIQVRIENHFGRKAKVVYAVELVNELGEETQRPSTSRTVLLRRGASADIDLRVPTSLADGFYLFRVTAAGRAGQETADAGVEIGFVLSGDSTQLLSDEDWLQLSFANEGVVQ